MVGQHTRHRRRLARQEAVGSELGGYEADLAHLFEHSIRTQLVAPTRHFADTPGDWCTRDLVLRTSRLFGGHVIGTSSYAATQPGFATAAGWRAASTSTMPRAASTNVAAAARRDIPIRCGVSTTSGWSNRAWCSGGSFSKTSS